MIEGDFIVEYYSNGQLEWKIPIIKRSGGRPPLLHGEAIQYYPDGKVKLRRTCMNGKEEGDEVLYHKNGKVAHRLSFIHGKKQGTFKTYDEDGKKESEVDYEDSKIKNVPRRWGKDGKPVTVRPSAATEKVLSRGNK